MALGELKMKNTIAVALLLLAGRAHAIGGLRSQDFDNVKAVTLRSTWSWVAQDVNGNTITISSNAVVRCIKFSGDSSQICTAAGTYITLGSSPTWTGAHAFNNQVQVSSQIRFADGTVVYSTSQFAGSGSGGGGNTFTSVAFRLNDFTAAANGVTTAFALGTNVSLSSGILVVVDGHTQLYNRDYTFTPPATITFTTAPAADSDSVFVWYTVDVTSSPQAAVLAATQTFSGVNTFQNYFRLATGAAAGYMLYSDAQGNASWGPAPSASGLLTSTNIWSGGNALYGPTTFYGTLNGDGSMLTNVPHDPVLIGLNVRANTTDTLSDKLFVRTDGQVGYYYIGMPPAMYSSSTIAGYNSTDVQTINEANTELVSFVNGTLKNLGCVGQTSPFSSVGNQTWTVRKNGLPTTLTCSINSVGVRSCSDTTHAPTIAAGDRFSLQTSSGDARVVNGACYFQLAF